VIKINTGLLNSSNYLRSAVRIPKPVLKTFVSKVSNADTIAVLTHISPDQDTLSSSMAIYDWLKQLGKNVSLCVNIKDTKGLYFPSPKHYKIKTDLSKTSDLIFANDFNGYERLSENSAKALKSIAEGKKLGTDHHYFSSTLISKDNFFIDPEFGSNSGITYMLLTDLKAKINKADLEALYCGMLSDYTKSKFVSIKGGKLTKLPALCENKKANAVLKRIELNLSQRSKDKIYKNLDILSRLTPAEQTFSKNLISKVKVTKNGELAYIVIPQGDKEWINLGEDNPITSAILSDMRPRILNPEKETAFSPELRGKLKNVKGAIIFYSAVEKGKSVYKMSIHSKSDYAKRLIDYVKTNINPNLIAGGHEDRAGGSVLSCQKADVDKFINDFLTAADALK